MHIWPYSRVGQGPRPPIVFLHGFLGQRGDWASVVDRLTGRYPGQFIQFDLPGHGEHIGPRPASLDFDQLADELAASLNALGIAVCQLVGYSLGGRLALSFAMAHPDRVDHLVLESASPGIEAPDAREQRTQLDQARAEKLIEQGLPEFLENWYQMPLFESLRKKGLVSELIKSRSMGDPVWLARTIEAFSPGRQRSNWSRLAELATPTLLLTGALDPAYQAAMARADRLLPNSQHRSIALAGHNIHLEQPDLFSDAILAFLKGCRRAEN